MQSTQLDTEIMAPTDLSAHQSGLASSSPKIRAESCRQLEQYILLQGFNREEYSGVLHLIWARYLYYPDGQTRQAVRRLITTILHCSSLDSDEIRLFMASLVAASQYSNHAPSQALVLLHWCRITLNHLSQERARWVKYGADALTACANCLESCATSLKSRASVLRSARLLVYRTILRLLRVPAISSASFQEIVVPILARKPKVPINHIAFISELIRACRVEPSLREQLEDGRMRLYSYIVDSLVNEHPPPSPALVTLLPTPLLLQELPQFLDSTELQSIEPTEIGIYRASEETPFVDVLSTGQNGKLPSKGSKEYDALKWEIELRSELAKKNGGNRKLNPKEREKVNAQLGKEKQIRSRIGLIQQRLAVGLGLVHVLALVPPSEGLFWLPTSLDLVLKVIAADEQNLLGDQAIDLYTRLADHVHERLSDSRKDIAAASLRAIASLKDGVDSAAPDLEELVSAVLYKLRFAAEEAPFDVETVAYCLPLVFHVLHNGGVAGKTQEKADEQIVLAIEFLTFQAECLSFRKLPREEVLRTLIYAMDQYHAHHQIIRDCFAACVREFSENITTAELGVLLSATLAPQASTRAAALTCVNSFIDLTDLESSNELWIACHDELPENAELALEAWEKNGLDVEEYSAGLVIPSLESKDEHLRGAAARAIGDALEHYPEMFSTTMHALQNLFKGKAKPRVQKYDKLGMPIRMDYSDPWEARHGVAASFEALVDCFPGAMLPDFLNFLIRDGPLSDRNSSVRIKMLDAAKSIIDRHGKDQLESLMSLCEKLLEGSTSDSRQSDQVNEAIIILYGALASHLSARDTRLPQIIDRLIEALKTPSESVQSAVADCLPPLFRESSERAADYTARLMQTLLDSKEYALRRGAAYGLAAFVRGRGVAVLKEYRILSSLKGALDDKKSPTRRQGVLLAYELFAHLLKQTFEPYIIQIIPQLLSSFGDTSLDVREACLDAAKACFASLTPYGVRRILPTLLDGLDDDQWRSKKGACDLLGAMAYLDPEQLARSLPDIIPPLTTVLNDSHKEVRLAANKSLQRFGEVIKNPEIKSLVPTLLKALSDPTKNTELALDSLIKTAFLHYLDAPSLALVVRILERGLRDRSATKRKSAQIIGSLTYLTERKDITVHLHILTNGLKSAIVDPVPATRATASKSLGSLVEKLGEDALPNLIPDLMTTLKSETSAGDRLGSAQALSEVLAGLGTTRLEETLPVILANVASVRPSVREGFMTLFLYLPICFGTSFSPYLGKIIPPILAGLADEAETIRETALTSGRLLVKNFASRSVDLLLPELEKGLMDDSYRIRLSSVELVGDLLFSLTGVSAKTAEEEEEDISRPEASVALKGILGPEKRDRVLSLLYICRCDTAASVRVAAVGVWKALVRTPKTLRELVPTLTRIIIQRLANPNPEQKLIAGNSLAELIRKAGEGVMTTLLPILKQGLQTSDASEKGAVCIALKELISSAAMETLEENEATLVSVVRAALTDPRSEVREAAAEAFDSLQHIFGRRAVDEIVPDLLSKLSDKEGAGDALSALLTLMNSNTRSNMILPTLLPTLLASPITRFNARAIGALAQVAGPALNRRLPHILGGLIDNTIGCKDEELRTELQAAFDTVMLSLDEDDGLNGAVSSILHFAKSDDHHKRAEADNRMRSFFSKTELDFSRYVPDFIRVLLVSFDDRDPGVVRAAHAALTELTSKLRKEDMDPLITSTRQALSQTGTTNHELPGFKLPKGINAILPIFVQGLMAGSGDQRIQAALGINDIIGKATLDSLKPSITLIAGPLIRVVTEKTIELKSTVLFVLNNLLLKAPVPLKPFLPQLQRTFARALAEPGSEILRNRAAKALGTLITLTPKIDPLIAELVTGSQSPDSGIRSAMVQALFEVVSKVGSSMNPASHTAIYELLDRPNEMDDEGAKVALARLLGAYAKHAPPEDAKRLVVRQCLPSELSRRNLLNVNAILLEHPDSLVLDDPTEKTFGVILAAIKNRSPEVSAPGVLACGKYLLSPSLIPEAPYEQVKALLTTLSSTLSPQTMPDVSTRRLALVVIRTVARLRPQSTRPHQGVLAPAIFTCVRDPVTPVKLAAEAAFVALFNLVHEDQTFRKYADGLPPAEAVRGRVMGEWIRRTGSRVAEDERVGKDTGGATGDEDEEEIWSVGKLNVGDDTL